MPCEIDVLSPIIEVGELPKNTLDNATYSINQNQTNSYTHGFFKYPCKFIPEIPKWAILKYAKKDSLIFDPFSGSGTTLLEAQLLGFDSFGTEIDPVAKKIIKAKTQRYDPSDLQDIDYTYKSILESLVKIDENNDYFIPDINNIEHWFNENNIKVLGKLKSLIENISNANSKSFFEVVLLSIIKSVSNADDASPKPYVSSRIIKIPPNALDKFSSTFTRYRAMLDDYHQTKVTNTVEIVDGDALYTRTPFKANLAVTSPPYINAFDYPRTLRLENLWLNTQTEKSILDSKSDYVGTEKFNLKDEKQKNMEILDFSNLLKEKFNSIILVDEKRAYVVKKFFEDMKQNLINVNEHLDVGGHYVIVIGNSVIRKNLVESWVILKDISEHLGYSYIEHFSYKIKNPYIRIPRSGRGGIIKKDHVLVLRKEKDINDIQKPR